MTCCWRAVMDQQLSEDWISPTAPEPVGWSDRQSDRSQDVRQGRNTKSALVPQKGWHCRDGSSCCRECQYTVQTAVSPWLLWLAKQIISFLIMIRRVIIYTKVAHSPVLRRQGSCFLPLVKGNNSVFSWVLPKMNRAKKLFSEKQSRTLLITPSYSYVIKCFICERNKRSLTR